MNIRQKIMRGYFFIPPILKGIDYLTTKMILDQGGVELNPFMAFLMREFGTSIAFLLGIGIYLVASILQFVVFSRTKDNKNKILALISASIFMIFVIEPVRHNLIELLSH